MSKHFRTIVGGRAGSYEDRKNYPRGIDILLKKAKVDSSFRESLLNDPLAAAESIDLTLQESERNILVNTQTPVLEKMIQNTFVPKHHVRTFLTQKAPVLLALLMASAVVLNTASSEGETADEMVEYGVEEATDKMAVLQSVLEKYKSDQGEYPSTEQWLEDTNPLKKYIETNYLFDPWKRKFNYNGIADESGKITDYFLESLGLDPDDLGDNIPCPDFTHRFPHAE